MRTCKSSSSANATSVVSSIARALQRVRKLLKKYADQADIDIVQSVPTSVPRRGPRTIIRQPRPTKKAIKTGLKVSISGPFRDFWQLANRRLQALGHLAADFQVHWAFQANPCFRIRT